MKELFVVIVMGLWTYAWYRLGYVEAQINENLRKIRELNKDIERRMDRIQKSIGEHNLPYKDME